MCHFHAVMVGGLTFQFNELQAKMGNIDSIRLVRARLGMYLIAHYFALALKLFLTI